jgi:O-antigen/teichoic acid export membrane protein
MLNRRKFLTDWSANFASVGLLSVTGIVLNSVIATVYGAAVLGIFNQVLAIYVLGSQLATFGIHFSVLKHVAEFHDDENAVAKCVASSLAAVAACAAISVALFFAIFRYSPIQPFNREVVVGVFYMLPALWFFAINKTLLNALNGRQANKLYASFVSLRYLLVLIFFVGAVLLKLPGEQLSIVLSLSESALLLAIVPAYLKFFPSRSALISFEWIKKHFHFGSRSLLGGFAVELNTRVDVLLLGIFTSNVAVGSYSFAALFVEGMLQLPFIARRLIDPVLTRLMVENDLHGRADLLVRGRNFGGVFMAAVGASMAIAYPWYATWLGGREIAMASWPLFSILTAGACIFATYAMFGGIFLQTGLPAVQTWLNLVILATNLALNLLLVPVWGALGAAIATSLSLAAGTLYLRVLVFRFLNVRF